MIDAYELLTRRMRANDSVARQESLQSPIEALRGLRAALSDALRKGAQNDPGDTAGARKEPSGAGGAGGPAGGAHEERRKEVRRKADLPIVLDTRTYQRRQADRANASSPAINVEI